MDFIHTLQIVLFCMCKISAQYRNHTGKHFVVAFFRNLDLIKMDAYLLVTGVGDASVTTSVFYPMPKHNWSSSFTQHPGMVKQFSVKNVKQIGTTNIPFPVFRIKASHPVSVTAFVDGPRSTASYLAIPSDIAGTEYRMMPVCDSSKRDLCVCIIVTLAENTFVTLLNDNHGNISVVMSVDGVDQTTDWSLPRTAKSFFLNNSFSYMSLESKNDFTGLLVHADQTVAVFCGTSRQGYTVSMEQVLPVTQFGLSFRHFHVPQLRVYRLRLISHYNCTVIKIGSNQYTQNSGEYKDFYFTIANDINSHKPIAVLQIFSESGKKPGEGLLVVPAIKQYFSTAVVPKRNEDMPKGPMLMHISINYKTCYYSMLGNITFQKQAIGFTFFYPKDNNNPLVMNVKQESCGNCENGFGIYVNRISSERGGSINVAGFQFLSDENQTSRYGGTPCGKKRVSNEDTNLPPKLYTKDAYHTTGRSKLEHGPRTTMSSDILKKKKTTTKTEILTKKKPTTVINSSSSLFLNCTCNSYPKQENDLPTIKKLQEKMKMVREDLLLDKRSLSSYRRRKTSADDDRLSSKGIGMVGVCVLCTFAAVIFLMDFNTLTHHGTILLRKIIRLKDRGGIFRKP